MLKEVHAIKALYADRAYDRHRLYKLCKEYDIKAKIPPKNGAAEHLKLNYMAERNAAIRLMQRRWNEEVEKANKLRKKILCRKFFLATETNIRV